MRKLARQQRLRDSELAAWRRFLVAHARISRRLEADLLEHHGLALSDYDVLVQLSQAPERRLRNVELARAVLLTRSGITRVVQRLERHGLVERVSCPTDRRGSLIRLTEGGYGKLREAAGTHLRGVRELFVEPLGRRELETLSSLLERLSSDADRQRVAATDPSERAVRATALRA